MIESLTVFPVQTNDLTVFRRAIEIQNRYQTSFWDATILAAAELLGCDKVLSEDLNHEQKYGGLAVENPFTP